MNGHSIWFVKKSIGPILVLGLLELTALGGFKRKTKKKEVTNKNY